MKLGHIIHGDSKLTLYVGILANVILTVTNLFSQIFIRTAGRSRNNAANKAQMILLVLNFVLPWITQILYFYLSRTREYMADAAAVDLTSDNQAMISALKKYRVSTKPTSMIRRVQGKLTVRPLIFLIRAILCFQLTLRLKIALRY